MRFRLTRNLACRLSHPSWPLCCVEQRWPRRVPGSGAARKGISLEPYAANILRVTTSTDQAAAAAAAGYGIVASPSSAGWTHERYREGYDVFRSGRMVVRVAPGNLPEDQQPRPGPLDALNLEQRHRYFSGGGGNGPNDGGRGPHNDALVVTTSEGKMLLHMRTWMMGPKRPEVVATDADPEGDS